MASQRDIADRAGCSLASVNRVLTGKGAFSDDIASRVLRAAAELGHRLAGEAAIGPAMEVASTPGARRSAIGVLVPSVTNPVFAQALSRIQERMRFAGHGVLIAQSNYDPAEEAHAVAGLVAERVLGLILTLCDVEQSPVLDLALPPTVLLYNPHTPRCPAAVTVDNLAASRLLVDTLIAAGHRRILFVSGSFAASDRARRRFDGYRAAMAAAGLPVLAALEVSFTEDYAHLDLTGAFQASAPTAIVASNDLLALGVVTAVRRMGLCVPRDVSVAGFDGIAIGRMVSPILSTVNMPNTAMGAVAASMLLDMIHRGAEPRRLELGVQLHPGETIAPPSKGLE